GPILVAFQATGFGGGNGMQFLSLDSLKPLEVRHAGERPNRGLGDGYFLNASADGRHFGLRDGTGGEPHTCSLITLGEDGLKVVQSWGFAGSVVVPSPDGRYAHAASGVYNAELKKLHPQKAGGLAG